MLLGHEGIPPGVVNGMVFTSPPGRIRVHMGNEVYVTRWVAMIPPTNQKPGRPPPTSRSQSQPSTAVATPLEILAGASLGKTQDGSCRGSVCKKNKSEENGRKSNRHRRTARKTRRVKRNREGERKNKKGCFFYDLDPILVCRKDGFLFSSLCSFCLGGLGVLRVAISFSSSGLCRYPRSARFYHELGRGPSSTDG